MAAVCDVALIAKVAGVRPDIVAQVAEVGHAGDVTALGVHRAGGKDVGDESARVADLLQIVPRLVRTLFVFAQLDIGKLGQIVEALKHDRHNIDLLVFRDVGIGVRLEHSLCVGILVAFGLTLDRVRQTVQEGIDKALGQIDLGGRPLVDIVLVLRPLVPGGLGHRPAGAEQPDHADEQAERDQTARRASLPGACRIGAANDSQNEHGQGERADGEKDFGADGRNIAIRHVQTLGGKP